MAAHRRKRNAGRLGEFARAPRPITQEVHDAPAMWVGKCSERAVEMVATHVSVSYLNPVAFSISSLDVFLTGCENVQ